MIIKNINDVTLSNDITIIVPSYKEIYYKKKYINKNYNFITLRNYLLKEYDGSKTLISDYENYLIMYKALSMVSSSLSNYKEYVSFNFVNDLLSTYNDFFDYELIDNDKINDIKKIYKKYEELLDENNFINDRLLKEYMLNNHEFEDDVLFLDLELPSKIDSLLIEKMNAVVIPSNVNNNYLKNMLGIDPVNKVYTNEFLYHEFNDIEEEVDFVLNDISKKVLEGYNYDDFVIVSNNIDQYYPYFDLLFNIPYNKEEKEGLLTSRFISIFNDILKGSFTCDNFVSLLKLGICKIDDKMVDKLDNYVYSWDLENDNFYAPFTYNPNGNKGNLNEYDKNDLKELNDAKEGILTPIKYLLENVIHENDKLSILRFFYTYLNEEGIMDKLYEKDYEGASNLVRALESINDYLNDYTTIHEVLGLLNVFDLVNKSNRVLNNAVLVCSLNDALYEDKKFVYLLDASIKSLETEFKASSLISYDDIKEENLIDLINNHNDKTHFLLSKLLDNKNVMITYHKLGIDLRLNDLSNLVSKLNLVNYSNDKNYNVNILKKEYASKLSNNLIYEENIFNNINISHKHDLNKRISKESAKKLYGNEINISPSSIESYAKCPFYHFCAYALRLKVKEKYIFDNRQLGTFVHYVLEQIIKNDLNEIDKDNLDYYVNKYSKNYLESNGKMVNEETKYVLKVLSKSTKEVIKNILNENDSSKFKPTYTEFKIGNNEVIKPVEIKLNDSIIKLSGTIDRVDTYEDDDNYYYRIIDYKTGKKEFKLDEVLLGLNLQMLLYLLAIKENGSNLTNKKVIPSGLLYYPALLKEEKEPRFSNKKDKSIKDRLIMNGIIDKDRLDLYGDDVTDYVKITSRNAISDEYLYDSKSLELIFNNVKNTLREISKKMLDGDIKIDPIGKDVDSCKYCKFSSVCAFDDKNDKKRKVDTHKNSEVIMMLEGDNNA